MAQSDENPKPSSGNALEEKPEPVPLVEVPPAESAIPAATDYYFMDSLYGMGDYPSFSTLLDSPDALTRLKQFYTDLNLMVDCVEYHTQSLSYDGTYTGDVKFSRNGALNQEGDDNTTHTSSCVKYGQNFQIRGMSTIPTTTAGFPWTQTTW